MTYVRLMNDGHTHQPMFSINCSRLQLDRLPGFVPKNTTVFYATDNRIVDLEPLRTTYRDVQDVYLDYNLITSIDILEADYWLNNFRVFSLKGNKLTAVRVHSIYIVYVISPQNRLLQYYIYIASCLRSAQRARAQPQRRQAVPQPESVALRLQVHATLPGAADALPHGRPGRGERHVQVHRGRRQFRGASDEAATRRLLQAEHRVPHPAVGPVEWRAEHVDRVGAGQAGVRLLSLSEVGPAAVDRDQIAVAGRRRRRRRGDTTHTKEITGK